MIDFIVVFLTFLVSVEFFSFYFIEPYIYNIFQVVLLIFFIIDYIFSKIKNKNSIKEFKRFATGIYFIFLGIFLSDISAQLFFKQSITVTILTQRYLYFYFFYFYLHEKRIDVKLIESLIVLFAILFVIIYYYIYFTNDYKLINSMVLIERDTIRISLPGILFVQVAIFYFLDNYFINKKFYQLLFVAIFLIQIITTGTRSIIITTLLVILLATLKYFKDNSKIRSTIFIFIITTVLYFLIDIFQNILGLTLYEIASQSGNYGIRLESVAFYFSVLFTNPWTYLLGNGLASELTNYGQTILYYKLKYNLYQSDIGLIGEYIRFGAFFIIGVLILIFQMIKSKKINHIKYSYIYIILTSIILSHFGVTSHIALICSLFYIDDINSALNI